jgi:SAM-dependent methyltransferase
MSVSEAYRDDLAYIHDSGFGHFARDAAPFLTEQLQRGRIDGGLVVELGCGGGILAEHVASAGYDVLGVDISEAQVKMARRRVPKAEFRCESLWSAEIPPCVAVVAVGECFNYLFDSSNTRRALSRLLRRIHAALAPRGLLLFDAAGLNRAPGPGRHKTYIEGDDWVVLVTYDQARDLMTRRIMSFRKVGETYRRDDEVHRLRLIPKAELVEKLGALGFRVRILRSYGTTPFPKGLTGVLARK